MAYLTAVEVRSRVERTASVDPLAGYSDTDIDELVSEFEDIAEDYLRIAGEPRSGVVDVIEVYTATDRLVLSWTNVRSITSVVIDGSTLGASSYELLAKPGVLRRKTSLFVPGYPVTVTYSHGLDAPPAALLRACALYVASVAESEQSGTSRNVLSQGMDGGTTRYSTPDKNAGRPTGWLEVDRLLNSLPHARLPGIG